MTDAEPTMSKQQANYTDGPVAIRSCKWCGSDIFALIMLMKGKCTLVKGPISPQGSCDHWQKGFRS